MVKVIDVDSESLDNEDKDKSDDGSFRMQERSNRIQTSKAEFTNYGVDNKNRARQFTQQSTGSCMAKGVGQDKHVFDDVTSNATYMKKPNDL